MFKFYLIVLTMVLQACSATSSKGSFIWCDNLFGVMDKIQTSAQYPNVRYQYVPTGKDLSDFKGADTVQQLEKNYFYIHAFFDPNVEAVAQKTNEDCWAACSIMLLKHDKVPFPNDKVEKVREKLYNAKESKDELSIYMTLFNSLKKATYSRPVVRDMLIRSLGGDHIMLVGFNKGGGNEGHVKIVYGCYFSIIPASLVDELAHRKCNMAIDKVLLLDPDRGVKQEMSGEEFKNTADFAISFVPDISTISFIQQIE